MKRLSISMAAVAAMAMLGGTAQAAAFYKDKTVRIIVPSGSGGTYMLYCQILSRHLGKYLGSGTKQKRLPSGTADEHETHALMIPNLTTPALFYLFADRAAKRGLARVTQAPSFGYRALPSLTS